MAKYKLTYFSNRGYAEPIRFLLSYGKIDFEDIRITYDQWPTLKKQLPFGHLPVLEYKGKMGLQSVAIARYVAKHVNLTGRDEWEDLEIDAMVDTLKEFSDKIGKNHFLSDLERTERDKLAKELLPLFLKKLEEVVQRNNGFLATDRLTWADLYFACLGEKLDLACFSGLNALREKVYEIPSIKNWMKIRPV